jgi:MATE family multidrug resistance protein
VRTAAELVPSCSSDLTPSRACILTRCAFRVAQFGFLGAAWSLPINQWLLFCTCIAIDKCQGISAKCWPRWSVAALRGWGPLLRMGSAGTLTTMGEWWSWEICAGMAGTLGAIPLAAHITIQNFSFFYFPLPFSVSMGATIRVGQLLGAGSPENAKLVLKISLCVTNAIMFTCAAIVWTFRSDFAAIYTADAEVIAKVAGVVDVYVFFILLGGSTQCLRGVLAGCGRQAINARVSLLASYGVGLPISYTMCFQLGWGLAGLWLGLVCSNIFRTLCLMYITFRQDWQALSDTAVAKAAEKVGEQEEKKSILAPGDSGSDSD